MGVAALMARPSKPTHPLTTRALRSAIHSHQMLTTGECARWMGVGTAYVRAEIIEGFLIANNIGKFAHRMDYRIYFPNFVAYLRARRWSRIPIDPAELR